MNPCSSLTPTAVRQMTGTREEYRWGSLSWVRCVEKIESILAWECNLRGLHAAEMYPCRNPNSFCSFLSSLHPAWSPPYIVQEEKELVLQQISGPAGEQIRQLTCGRTSGGLAMAFSTQMHRLCNCSTNTPCNPLCFVLPISRAFRCPTKIDKNRPRSQKYHLTKLQ